MISHTGTLQVMVKDQLTTIGVIGSPVNLT